MVLLNIKWDNKWLCVELKKKKINMIQKVMIGIDKKNTHYFIQKI